MAWETLVWAKAQRTGSVGRKAVLMALAEYADERESCNPSHEAIAYDTEMSVRSVIRHIQALVDAGLVYVEPQWSESGLQDVNRYFLRTQKPHGLGSDKMTGGSDNDTRKPHGLGSDNVTPPAKMSPKTGGSPLSERESTHPESSSSLNSDPYSAAFEDAWSAYPRKIGKKAAWRAWKATVRRHRSSGVDIRPSLVAASRNYAASVRDRSVDKIKHGSTFFGPDEPWEDYVTGDPNRDTLDDWKSKVPQSLWH